MIVYGINTVLEALKAKRVRRLRMGSRSDKRMEEIVALAAAQRVPVERDDADALDRAARGGVHQGVVADVEEAREFSIEELVIPPDSDLPPTGGSYKSLLVVLDGIEDPHNVGAILRSVDAAGADGVVRQSRRAAPLGGATAKASAGAVAHVKVADVVNIARALEILKGAGVWTVGLAGDAIFM